MSKSLLQPIQIYHEIGHAIIAYIFNEHILSFKKIILNTVDLANIMGHQDNLAYTHTKRIGPLELERIKENEHLCTLIVGLTTLGGIGGATYLFPSHPLNFSEVTILNFHQTLNLSGASGDFQIIKEGGDLYSYNLLSNGYDEYSMYLIHSKIMNIIQHLFLKPEIKKAADQIFKHIQRNPTENVELSKFSEVLDIDIILALRNELEELLSQEKFGKLY